MIIGITIHDNDFRWTYYGALRMLNTTFKAAQENIILTDQDNGPNYRVFLSILELPEDRQEPDESDDCVYSIYSRKKYIAELINALLPVSYELNQNFSKIFSNERMKYLELTEENIFFDEEIVSDKFLFYAYHGDGGMAMYLDTSKNFTLENPLTIF